MRRYPILTFHSIDGSGSPISMTRSRFRAVMTELAQAGWRGGTVTELLDLGRRGEEASDRFAITFDDGYTNVAAEAAPVLADLGFTATIFAITGRVGADNEWPGQPAWVPRMALLGWDGLGRLSEAGWEVASHCVQHLPLTTLGDREADDQLTTAIEEIRRRLAVEAPLMAYPYGAHDARIRALVARHHRAALGVRLRAASPADLADRYDIPRIDAYYLTALSPRVALGTARGRGYLALRRWARSLRGRDWTAAAARRSNGH